MNDIHREASRERHYLVSKNWVGTCVGRLFSWSVATLIHARILPVHRGLALHAWGARKLVDVGLLRYERRAHRGDGTYISREKL